MRINSFLIAVLVVFTGYGQTMVDDSTELVYGPETTTFTYEQDLKNNFPKERHPDTTLVNLEDFTQLDRNGDMYQDLGNNGTALFPIFYPLSETVGLTSGFNAYDLYMVQPEQVRYFDTKSPFMDVYVVFGGQGRAVADFSYSRNVNKDWNVGFDIHRITSDKQIGKQATGDRNAVGTTFDVYTYFRHPNLPYTVLFNVVNMTHNVEETGGIVVPEDAPRESFFEYQDAAIQLSDAQGYDKRNNLHLYHQYAWQKQLQFYHQADWKRQEIGYKDFGVENDADYYDEILIDPDSTYERVNFNQVINEAGIKGDLASLFYRIYIKSRILSGGYFYLDPLDREAETYLGYYTRFTWKDKFNVESEGELLHTGDYRFVGRINSDLIFGSYISQLTRPSMLVQRYFGNHHYWDNNFQSSFSNEIKGGIQVKTPYFLLRPTVRLLTLSQFIYFNEDIEPQQRSGAFLGSFGGKANFTLFTDRANNEGFHLDNEFFYTQTTGQSGNLLRVPELFYHGRIYWNGAWFKNTMGVDIGFDVHAKTAYYALDYVPSIQQFYLQDDFLIEAFWAADLFVNIKVDKLRIFFKYTHVNQPTDDGYFITPYYPGERGMTGVGAKWLFFD